MTEREALSYIHALKRFGAVPGLERMTALMSLLGDPQERLKIVHVAGTNGKGSTVAMLVGMLGAAGYKTGMYTSPFILNFRERIRINDEMIPPESLASLVEEIKPFAEQVGEITEFELVTAVAFLYFARADCEIVVLETGLGGRFDATNVIKHPLLSVITQIGLDHTEILGDTIEQIAFEKCGIIKRGAPVITCAGQSTDAFAVILEQTCKGGGVVIQPTLAAVRDVRMSIEGTDLAYNGNRLHIPLAGKHQIDNALTAYTTAERLSLTCGFGALFADGSVANGLAAVKFPARAEIVSREPLTILDGAHNPQGAAALAETLTLLGDTPITGVMGMLADKNVDGTLAALAPRFKRLICLTPQSPRAMLAHALAARADAIGLAASAAHGAEEAWELASAVAAAEHGAVVVCGSLYLAAEMRGVILAE